MFSESVCAAYGVMVIKMKENTVCASAPGRTVHILNPEAGDKKLYKAARADIERHGGEILIGKRAGGTREMVESLFRSDAHARAVVYGGDGTVFETVNGIIDSGAASTASFSVVPGGSGNDFSTYVNDKSIFESGVPHKIDLIKTVSDGETRYFANLMNIGFDCSVVWETYTLKKNPLFRGSAAYIAGVVKVLAKKNVMHAKITLTGCVDLESGSPLPDYTAEQDVLLVACANGRFCGGGFKAAPLASVTDSYMDVLIINDVSRMQFISLVGDYRRGSYINTNGEMLDKFKSVISYRRCRKMKMEGLDRFCLDGEIFGTGEDKCVEAEVVPGAVWYSSL